VGEEYPCRRGILVRRGIVVWERNTREERNSRVGEEYSCRRGILV
jgi:hypothetical protein